MRRSFHANKSVTIPQFLPVEGFVIPIREAIWGGDKILFNEDNRFSSNLILYNDHFDFNVLGKYSYKYTDVKDVGFYSKYWGNVEIEITLVNSDKNYYAFMNKGKLKEILKFFKKQNCKLTGKAEKFISQ